MIGSLFFRDPAGNRYPAAGPAWKGAAGLFSISALLDDLDAAAPFPLVTLGEQPTPVVRRSFHGTELLLKLDYLLPTGSFKDRGARYLVSALAAMGIRSVVEDSSGNAGAALAAYAAAAGMESTIVIPASATGPVVDQIAATATRLVRAEGGRSGAAREAHRLAGSSYYASHVFNPLFFAGTAQVAAEIEGRAGAMPPPASIVVPVGNGTLLGLYHGYRRLARMPVLAGSRLDRSVPPERAALLAPGIAVSEPARAEEIAEAVAAAGGRVTGIGDEPVLLAQRELARGGLYVESTSAVAVAGALDLLRSGAIPAPVMVILTGSGLKRPPIAR